MFPAYAGMIRLPVQVRAPGRGVPRLRGDDPVLEITGDDKAKCSPPTRG